MYKPVYRLTPYLIKLLEEAAGLRAWIENMPLKVAWLPVLRQEARIRATHSSTAIEGNPLTLDQVAAVAQGENIGAPARDRLEIENYIKVMRWVEKHVGDKVSEKSLLKIHKLLTQGLLAGAKAGRYKERQNYVIDEKGIRIFTPPNPKSTPGLVKDLLRWLVSAEAVDLPPIVVCAIFHHRLVSIHPFTDGNGRLARALGTWLLYQRGFDTYHIFSLDDFFASDRKRYYQKLQQARDLDDNLTFWIEYVAEGVVGTLKEVKARIESLQVSSKYDLALTPGQEELLRILRSNRPQSSAELRKRFKVSRARVNQIIAPLLRAGLIGKSGQGRATRYFFLPTN